MREQAGHSWLAHPTPRDGQAEMIAACIGTLQKGEAHLASAPTGIGKTAAALAAALEIRELIRRAQNHNVPYSKTKSAQNCG